jgi:hypothetical protein
LVGKKRFLFSKCGHINFILIALFCEIGQRHIYHTFGKYELSQTNFATYIAFIAKVMEKKSLKVDETKTFMCKIKMVNVKI